MTDLVVGMDMDVDVLAGFSDGWKDGLKEIDGSQPALLRMLTDSAQVFRVTESKLAGSATPKQ